MGQTFQQARHRGAAADRMIFVSAGRDFPLPVPRFTARNTGWMP